MKLGELEYLCNHIFYHVYNTCLAIRGLAYETVSTSGKPMVGTNWKRRQAECPSEDAKAWTTATTKA
jgi:hypothetical protein